MNAVTRRIDDRCRDEDEELFILRVGKRRSQFFSVELINYQLVAQVTEHQGLPIRDIRREHRLSDSRFWKRQVGILEPFIDLQKLPGILVTEKLRHGGDYRHL